MSVSKQDHKEQSSSDTESSQTTDAEESQPSEPSLDVVFDVLRNRRRRLVMKALEERDGSTTLSDLAEHIGGIENDKPPQALNAQERKRVYVGLYQCHLPKMDDADAIEFDKNRGTVERGEMADRYHEYLQRDVDAKSGWPIYYGGVSAVAAATYAAVVVLAGPQPIVAMGSLVLVGALAAYHWSGSSE